MNKYQDSIVEHCSIACYGNDFVLCYFSESHEIKGVSLTGKTLNGQIIKKPKHVISQERLIEMIEEEIILIKKNNHE